MPYTEQLRIDVAKELTACVRQLNGVIGDDIFNGSNGKDNADYWFPDARVVGELKCLTENLLSKENHQDRIQKMHKSWVQRGLMPKPVGSKTTFNLQDLPEECAWEFLRPIKRKLDDYLGQANRQIRETKKFFDAPDAKGMLLLVNDGNHTFPPSMMNHLLARSTKNQYSSINSVIYLSVNEPASMPGFVTPKLFWFDIDLPGHDPVSVSFRQSLQQAWMTHYSALTKAPAVTFTGNPDPAFIDGIQFLKTP